MRRCSRLLCCVVLITAGCAEPPSTEPAPTEPLASGPLDARELAGIVERAHFAFRRAPDGAFGGGHTTYGAIARSGGAFEITPVGAAGAEAAIELETIAVGEDRDATASISVAEDGALEMERAGSIERLENRADGVEQSWRFERAPVQDGDLVVRVRVSAPHVATTERGLHFRATGAAAGLVYGTATWIDARGRRTELPPQPIEGGLVITVPSAIVSASTFPAVLDPLIGPEHAVDAPIVGANTFQTSPTVAFDGTRYLVAWVDSRHGYQAVLGTRVAVDGTVLDPSGLEISSGRELFTDFVVSAGDPSGFVVGWPERCLSCATSPVSLHATRVSSAGAVLDRPSVAVADDLGSADYSVAYGAGVYLFAYRTRTGPIWGRFFGPGTGLGAPFAIVGGTPSQPSVASDGTRFVVAYENGGDIVAVPVTAGAAVGTPVAVVTGSVAQTEPSLAFDGANYVLAWWESTTAWDIYARRLTPALGLLPTMAIATSTDSETRPTAASAGTGESVVLWTRLGTTVEVRSRRISSAGALLDPVGGVLVGPGTNSLVPFGVAGGASSFFVAFADATSHLRGVTVDASGASPAGGALLTTGVNAERQAAVAFDGTNHLVVWSDSRTGFYDVYGMRVDASGRPLDPAAIPIATDAARRDQMPDVAFGGGTYYVVWDSSGEVRGARVSTAGALVDSTPVVIGSSQWAGPAIASDGTGFLVAWNQSGIPFGGPISVRPISSATGAPTGAATTVQTVNAWNEDAVDVAYGGGAYLVVYTTGDVLARRVAASGALLGTGPLTLASTGDQELTPTVSYSGSAFLVAWERRASDADVYGARVSSAGTLLDATPRLLAGGAGRQLAPALAPDPSGYLLAWQHDPSTTYDVRVGWLDATGAPTADGNVAVATTSDPEIAPALTASAAGAALLAYEHHFYDGARPVRVVTRVLGRVGLATGAPCTIATECESGQCVDGVCCDGACGGGDPADCQACSVAAGASADGTCAPLVAGTSCRAAAGDCDLADACDGLSPACPADARAASDVVCRAAAGGCDVEERCAGDVTCPTDRIAASGTTCRGAAGVCDVEELCDGASPACPGDAPVVGVECRPSAGPCDVAEACDGSGPACPLDVVVAAGEVCRVATGACDVPESCDGTGPLCPPDAIAVAGTLCRVSSGACDPAESCDGTVVDCPGDALVADGTSCDDGTMCNGVDVCSAGACTPGAAPDCDDGDPCTTDTCTEPSGCDHDVAPGIPGCCTTATDCDDGDACTIETCATDGACVVEPESGCGDAGVDAGGAVDDDASVESGDGALRDAGAPRDAGGMDATAADGGVVVPEVSGCGCSTPGGERAGGATTVAMTIVVAVVSRTRRRSRRGR